MVKEHKRWIVSNLCGVAWEYGANVVQGSGSRAHVPPTQHVFTRSSDVTADFIAYKGIAPAKEMCVYTESWIVDEAEERRRAP